ncbi:MAG TPA: hypothetical protein VGN17_21415 [Bryobacteraceae bacterium]|jgi:hypothetical protein
MSERELRALRALAASLHALQQEIHAIRDHYEAAEHPEEPPADTVLNGVVSLLPAVTTYYETEQRNRPKRERRERNKRIVETVGVVLLAIYTAFTVGMYCANKTAAEAAKSAAETASKTLTSSIEQFRTDERAWIEIDHIDRTLVHAKDDKFGATFRYRLFPRNVGKTAAHAIIVNAARSMRTSIGLERNSEGMKGEQDTILLHALTPEARENPTPKVLAPATTAVIPFVIDGQEPQIVAKDEWVSYLIGRIDYTDDFGVSHWIKFCFYVGESNGTLWNCHEGNEEDRNPEVEPPQRR